MLNKKIIFFDIDGTLLDHNKSIPDSTKYAIYQLKKAGHQVAIATGRAPFMFDWVRRSLGIDTFVSVNGQYVVHENKPVYKNPIKKEELYQLETHAQSQSHPMAFMGVDTVVSNVDQHDFITQSFTSLNMKVPKKNPDYYHQEEIYQGLLFCRENDQSNYDDFTEPFDFVRWHDVALDILPKGGSKAKGIERLLDYLDINKEDTIAFGDALNDIDMLTFVNHGIAMGNGLPETKKVANFVTKDVSDDGIYYGLKQIGLI